MPKFKVPFEINGDLEIEANDIEHAIMLAWGKSVEEVAGEGDLWMGRPQRVGDQLLPEPAKLAVTEAAQ
jgi:hypothetical protein